MPRAVAGVTRLSTDTDPITGQRYTWYGSLGLAPGWASGASPTMAEQQIITAYLNEIYYGHRAYGIAAAASVYFGVQDLAELTPAQAALLAGLPKSLVPVAGRLAGR